MAYETEDHETLYCFPAFNSSCVKEKRSTHEYYIMYVFFSLLSAWTVFLNLLVIISISHFKKLHTPTNLLILSLAVSDLLVGLVVMPVEAMKLIESCWYFGDTFCKMFLTIMGQLLSTSLSNLVLIAIDRYVAVCHPLLYPQKITTNRTLCSIGLCWFSSSAYNIALICISLNQGAEESMCNGECVVLPSLESRIIDLVISFVLPCTLIITFYLKIFCVAQRQVKFINSMKEAGKHITEGSAKRKSENKAAVTLGIVVAIHLLCWIPYYIMSLLENTAYFPIWVLYINSCLNPVVYAFFYPWFRKSVMHILTFRIVWTVSSQLNVSS